MTTECKMLVVSTLYGELELGLKCPKAIVCWLCLYGRKKLPKNWKLTFPTLDEFITHLLREHRHEIPFTTDKRKRLSKRQREILSLLTTYGEMSTRAIIEHLYPDKKVESQTSTYRSVCRTLGLMKGRGMVVKTVGVTTWRKPK